MQSPTFDKKTVLLNLLFSATAVVNGAAIPGLGSPNNTRSILDPRAGNNYRIVVYENAQCTGQAIPWSGDAEVCTNGLGSGGAGIQLLALDADAMLVFYNAPNCPAGGEVATFNTNEDKTGPDCKPLAGNPVSFAYIEV